MDKIFQLICQSKCETEFAFVWIYIIQVQIIETDFSESRMPSKNISGIKNFFLF